MYIYIIYIQYIYMYVYQDVLMNINYARDWLNLEAL